MSFAPGALTAKVPVTKIPVKGERNLDWLLGQQLVQEAIQGRTGPSDKTLAVVAEQDAPMGSRIRWIERVGTAA